MLLTGDYDTYYNNHYNCTVDTRITNYTKNFDEAILEFLSYYLRLPGDFIYKSIISGKLRVKDCQVATFHGSNTRFFAVKGETVLISKGVFGEITKVWKEDL